MICWHDKAYFYFASSVWRARCGRAIQETEAVAKSIVTRYKGQTLMLMVHIIYQKAVSNLFDTHPLLRDERLFTHPLLFVHVVPTLCCLSMLYPLLTVCPCCTHPLCHATVDQTTSLKPDYNMLPQNRPKLLC